MAHKNDSAVSPVVGVMLMLVVTIIIAAVVSAFAGGMGGSQSKTPQVSLSAEYSVANGMKIYHNGGDVLTIGDFKILIKPSKNFDSIESDAYVTVINQSLIWTGVILPATTNPPPGLPARPEMWYGSKGERVASRFAPGDIAIITAENCATEKLAPSMIYYGQNVGYNRTEKIGATFFLDFVTNDGKRIALIEVPIKG